MQRYKFLIFILGALCLSNVNAAAQKKQTKSKIAVSGQERPSTIFEDLLPATAKLIIVDSIVCDKNDFLKYIPLAKDCGRITTYNNFFTGQSAKRNNSYVYENGFGDKCFYNDSTKNGDSKLYTEEKLGGKWQAPRLLDELGNEFNDINYPYLMPDGVTLYFSAINKSNSLGGRDIYMTRLNNETMRFYKPENIGLPYNSKANDYCCIIDDINSIGWLVSDRSQRNGKVCIYTFIPTNERWTDNKTNIPQKKLENLAHITNIKDTWVDKEAVKNAKAIVSRLKNIANATEDNDNNITFIVNDKTIYKTISDFKSATGKQLYLQLSNLRKEMKTDERTLEILRKQITKAKAQDKKTISENILILENGSVKHYKEIRELEKKIRNAENIK